MTDEMKKYTNAVKRRLNLPKDVKERVMSDFVSSITARQEAGQTNAEIITELGTPKKAAAELNGQMKEYAYRKSPWRWLFLAAAVLSGGWLLLYRVMMGLGMLLSTLKISGESASIGIIGGADGPTAIFVASSQGPDWDAVLMGIVLVVSILAFLRLRKCRSKK